MNKKKFTFIDYRVFIELCPEFNIYRKDNTIWFDGRESGTEIEEKEYFDIIIPAIKKHIKEKHISEFYTEETGLLFNVSVKPDVFILELPARTR